MSQKPNVDVEAILAKLNELGDFADISPSLTAYDEPTGRKYYLTLDFVDAADAARRMPFRSRPKGTHEDPDGLLADWHAFEKKKFELSAAGEIGHTRMDCPAFHCVGDGSHPALRPYAEKFVARVPAHAEELAAILSKDGDYRNRAAAAYLLAYSKDGRSVVRLMIEAFRDRNSLVRNNAMRVVSDIAHYHPEIDVPIDPVLEALDYPATTDRNKAAAILDGLLGRPGSAALHDAIVERAGATLLAMLRLQQPNNHNFAYRIFKKLSGKSFGERDYASWEAWLQRRRPR